MMLKDAQGDQSRIWAIDMTRWPELDRLDRITASKAAAPWRQMGPFLQMATREDGKFKDTWESASQKGHRHVFAVISIVFR